MPYTKKIWCPHPIHSSLTRSGSKPTHPIGVRLIKEIEAQVFNKQIMVKPEWTPVTMKGGDKVCQTCFNSLGDLMDKYLYEEPVLIETPESEKHQPTSLNEQFKMDMAKEELNKVFKIVHMDVIRDE